MFTDAISTCCGRGATALYCRYDLFYHFPVAHALLYGVCKDFCKLVLRKSTEVLQHGQEEWLNGAARDQMQRILQFVRLTTSFSSTAKDITKYVSVEPPSVYLGHVFPLV